MSDLSFDGIACFKDGLTNAQRGKLAGYLTRACQHVPEARPAVIALGSLFDPEKRAEALRILNGMGSLTRRIVISRYLNLSRLSRD